MMFTIDCTYGVILHATIKSSDTKKLTFSRALRSALRSMIGTSRLSRAPINGYEPTKIQEPLKENADRRTYLPPDGEITKLAIAYPHTNARSLRMVVLTLGHRRLL